MTNSGFSQLFDRHEREDYSATLSETAIKQMISEEFEEADKIISAGASVKKRSRRSTQTVSRLSRQESPTNFICESIPPASSHIITVTRSMNLSMSCPASVPSTSEIQSEN